MTASATPENYTTLTDVTHVTRRRGELHHLGERAKVDSKPSRRLTTALPSI
jgi:hypothetical protein